MKALIRYWNIIMKILLTIVMLDLIFMPKILLLLALLYYYFCELLLYNEFAQAKLKNLTNILHFCIFQIFFFSFSQTCFLCNSATKVEAEHPDGQFRNYRAELPNDYSDYSSYEDRLQHNYSDDISSREK